VLRARNAILLIESAEPLLTLGDINGALQAAKQGQSILQNLLQSDPNNADWRRQLFVSYERIGDALMQEGKHSEALNAYQNELTIAEALAQSDPGKADWQSLVVT